MKRAKGDRLTGGTNDVNPQWMKILQETTPNITVAPGGTGTNNRSQRVAVPINRINQASPNTATILEVLKVRWSWGIGVTGTLPWLAGVAGYLVTASNPGEFTGLASKGTTVDWFSMEDAYSPYLAVGSGPYPTPQVTNNIVLPITHDLTDGDGHGILVATDFLTLSTTVQFENEAPAGAGNLIFDSLSVVCEILYRYKTVTLTEFVGIVQSQERGG